MVMCSYVVTTIQYIYDTLLHRVTNFHGAFFFFFFFFSFLPSFFIIFYKHKLILDLLMLTGGLMERHWGDIEILESINDLR